MATSKKTTSAASSPAKAGIPGLGDIPGMQPLEQIALIVHSATDELERNRP